MSKWMLYICFVCYCYTVFKVLDELSNLNYTYVYNFLGGTIYVYLIIDWFLNRNSASKKAQIELNKLKLNQTRIKLSNLKRVLFLGSLKENEWYVIRMECVMEGLLESEIYFTMIFFIVIILLRHLTEETKITRNYQI